MIFLHNTEIKTDPCKKDAAPAPAPTPAPCTGTCGEPSFKGDNSCDSQNNNCGCQWDGGDYAHITTIYKSSIHL